MMYVYTSFDICSVLQFGMYYAYIVMPGNLACQVVSKDRSDQCLCRSPLYLDDTFANTLKVKFK